MVERFAGVVVGKEVWIPEPGIDRKARETFETDARTAARSSRGNSDKAGACLIGGLKRLFASSESVA